MIAEWRRKQIEQAERLREEISEIERASKKSVKEQVVAISLERGDASKR